MTKRESKVMEGNILRFKAYIEKALRNKLMSNRELCGYKLLAPINSRDYTLVVFHATPVAKISAGKFEIAKFDKKVYGKDKFKYDVLNDIKIELLGEEEEPVPPIKVVKKRVTKKKKK